MPGLLRGAFQYLVSTSEHYLQIFLNVFQLFNSKRTFYKSFLKFSNFSTQKEHYPQISLNVFQLPPACRSRLESNAEQWTTLLCTLKELIAWLTIKDNELSQQQPVGGDIQSVRKQNDDHKVGDSRKSPMGLFVRIFRKKITDSRDNSSVLSTGIMKIIVGQFGLKRYTTNGDDTTLKTKGYNGKREWTDSSICVSVISDISLQSFTVSNKTGLRWSSRPPDFLKNQKFREFSATSDEG